MICKHVISLFVLCFIAWSSAGCPYMKDLPIKYNSNTFLCARVFEHGEPVAAVSCGGASKDIYNGKNNDFVGSWNDKVSSVVIRPGCKLDVWAHGSYRGDHVSLGPGGHHQMVRGKYARFNDKISSWSCSCTYTNDALRCLPKEYYNRVTRCSNINQGSMRCDYTLQKGMSFGYSVTRGGSISTLLEASMEASFLDIFKTSLKTSITTTFDWSRTDSTTFSKLTSTTVSCEVLPGKSMGIWQVIGKCGDTTVYTGHWECR